MNLKKTKILKLKKRTQSEVEEQLKQGKNFAFVKSVIPSINNSILSTPILSILNLN